MAGIQPWTKSFFLGTPAMLRTLTPEQKPLWGAMTPQQMVEHVVGSWRISNGRARVQAILPPEEISSRRETLFSGKPYEKNFQNPMFAKGLPPLRKPSLEAAIEQLEDEMKAFFEHHEVNPQAIEVHPIYGNMTYDEWMYFQTKHMMHHMSQFGLL